MKAVFALAIPLFSCLASAQSVRCSNIRGNGSDFAGVCATKSKSGSWTYSKKQLGKLKREGNGLAAVCFQQPNETSCFWVDKKGKMARALTVDLGPDEFSNGLARSVGDDGKLGYMNEKLKAVIPAEWDEAYRFMIDTTVVCKGCKQDPNDKDDHPKSIGGHYYVIDRAGKIKKDCGSPGKPVSGAPTDCAL